MEKRLVISFSDGEDVIGGIESALQEHGVDFAMFSNGSGCFKHFELSPPSNASPNFDYFLNSVSGSALRRKNGFDVNLRLTLFRRGNVKTALVSGRLKKGIASDNLNLILTLRHVKGIIQ